MSEDVIVRAVLYREGKVLALQNSEHDHDYARNRWELPGGWADGEKTEKAVKREVMEETGLESRIDRKLEKVRVEDERGSAVCQYFLVEAEEGEVEISEEHRDFRWIEPEEFKNMDWLYYAGYSIPVLKKASKML